MMFKIKTKKLTIKIERKSVDKNELKKSKKEKLENENIKDSGANNDYPMSKSYPFLKYMEMLTRYDYRSRYLKRNGEYMTFNRIRKELDINNSAWNKVIKLLEMKDLLIVKEKEIEKGKKRKKVIFIPKKVVDTLEQARKIRNSHIKY